MGLLDDAIREHLDLKRRRGADPAEVERAEREALGPVRRNREAPATTEVDEESAEGGAAYNQADDADWAYADAEAVGADSGDELALPPLEFAEPAFADTAFAGPPAAEPETAPADRGATTEFDVQEALAADDGTDEDVLEETPEFLSDTPDHDRLWFEQRPPKDFDFDG